MSQKWPNICNSYFCFCSMIKKYWWLLLCWQQMKRTVRYNINKIFWQQMKGDLVKENIELKTILSGLLSNSDISFNPHISCLNWRRPPVTLHIGKSATHVDGVPPLSTSRQQRNQRKWHQTRARNYFSKYHVMFLYKQQHLC